MRTQVGIVGAGPAGLTLARLLELAGVETVVLEARSREYCEQRIRAGVLEHPTADLLRSAGVADRLDREGIRHGGIYLQFEGERHHVAMDELVGLPNDGSLESRTTSAFFMSPPRARKTARAS